MSKQTFRSRSRGPCGALSAGPAHAAQVRQFAKRRPRSTMTMASGSRTRTIRRSGCIPARDHRTEEPDHRDAQGRRHRCLQLARLAYCSTSQACSPPIPSIRASASTTSIWCTASSSARKSSTLAVASDRGFDRLAIYEDQQERLRRGGAADRSDEDRPAVRVRGESERSQCRAHGDGHRHAPSWRTVRRLRSSRATTVREIAKFRLYDAGNGKVGYAPLVRFNLPSQFTLPNGQQWTAVPGRGRARRRWRRARSSIGIEGYVYIGQEAVGLWRTTIDNPGRSSDSSSRRWTTFGTPYTRTFDQEEEEYVCEYQTEQDPGYGGRLDARRRGRDAVRGG